MLGVVNRETALELIRLGKFSKYKIASDVQCGLFLSLYVSSRAGPRLYRGSAVDFHLSIYLFESQAKSFQDNPSSALL